MLKPFHLSFSVDNPASFKTFYQNVLGCEIGKEESSWYNIDFYGHQVTVHQSSEALPSLKLDHFGPILDRNEWESLSEKIEASGVPFISKFVRKDQEGKESGKFLIEDPAGNILEFKFYS